jgi:hypothetical protein
MTATALRSCGSFEGTSIALARLDESCYLVVTMKGNVPAMARTQTLKRRSRIMRSVWPGGTDIRVQSAEDRRLAPQQVTKPLVDAMQRARLRSYRFVSVNVPCAQSLCELVDDGTGHMFGRIPRCDQ